MTIGSRGAAGVAVGAEGGVAEVGDDAGRRQRLAAGGDLQDHSRAGRTVAATGGTARCSHSPCSRKRWASSGSRRITTFISAASSVQVIPFPL